MTDTACAIQTARLRIVPLAPHHITQRYADWLNAPALMAFSQHGGHSHSLASCKAYAASFDHKTKCLWALERRDDGRHVGNINAYLTLAQGVGDIGLLVGEPGLGYGQEAWSGVIHALFGHYHLRKVTGGCHADHFAMRQIMERSAMQMDGIRQRHAMRGDLAVDIVHMAMFAEDYQPPLDVELQAVPLINSSAWIS